MERITFAELSQVVAAAGGTLAAVGGEFRVVKADGSDLVIEVQSEIAANEE